MEKKESGSKKHYINNADFCKALIDYKTKVELSITNNTTKPAIPNYIGECFLKIAHGLSHKPNFINYSYRDEMIADGIENCIMYFENFDPLKSNNPFAYFTQIVYYAFLRRIQKEKKQQATKYKLLENIDIDSILAHSEGNEEFANSLLEMVRKQVDFIDIDRRTIPSKKKKVKDTEGTLDLE